MEKHLLVTVSDQKGVWYGLQFVGSLFENKDNIKLTLFYTAPKPVVWDDKSKMDTNRLMEQKAKEIAGKGEKDLAAAGSELVKLGFLKENVHTKLRFRGISKADDIIEEGEAGRYDAVVLGRRGLSWLEEAVDESVTGGILEKKTQIPMWICRRPDAKRSNLLLCLDGSDASLRMADHVGFILAGQNNHRITLFTVKKDEKITSENLQKITSDAKETIVTQGVPENLITTKIAKSDKVRKTILDEAKKERYAAVAVGRTGTGDGFLKKMFMGSVSTYLFKELEGSALWVCY
jgi:nucleotide-binding universal stress UspA family protein